jgi:hypothetical protein
MKPTVGRIVHYTMFRSNIPRDQPEAMAAIITGVTVHGVDLHVFLPPHYVEGKTSLEAEQVQFTEAEAGTEAAIGKWSWPARE